MSPYLLPLFAVVAGVISFSSPCCIPLLPGYVSYISALPTSTLGTKDARTTTFRASLAFVAGFALVFTTLGIASAFFGSFVLRSLPTIVRVMGVGIIVLGISMMGVVRIPFLMRERRMDVARLPRGPGGAFGVGVAFAAGWTPCIGPILAVILAAAAATRTVAWGGLLLMLYSLGLGLPFIALALGLDHARGSMAWLRRHGRHIEVVGGALMVGVGILFVTGTWEAWFRPLQRIFARYGWPPV
ncbi:MAG: cytochrome C biogenesis protein [Acidimicrobiales bacterium]|nr:cytochrome C biogenesis protein [Acidimicrobiales bacterium]